MNGTNGESLDDATGLARAYSASNSTYVDDNTGTAYIAGTKTSRDWLQDIGIGFGRTSATDRFAEAQRTLDAHPKVRRIVGHSLGGAVALEIQQNRPALSTTTYSAPVMSTRGGDRYREAYDPISIFDRGAKTMPLGGLNPHAYQRIAAGRYK